MMADGERVAAAAEQLVGTRFRLRGRDPATGLDCLGVVEWALRGGGRTLALPLDYHMRTHDVRRAAGFADRLGCAVVSDAIRPGDILLMHVGPSQHHFAVAVPGGCFVHANAGLRRVVCTPTAPEGTMIGHWRPVAT